MLEISPALRVKLLAASALTFLKVQCNISRTAVLDYEAGAFELSNSVRIRRPKQRTAQEVDPRVAPLDITEGGFFDGELVLEKQFGDAYPIYAHDPARSNEIYVREVGLTISDSLARPNEDYLYAKLRAFPATSGTGVQVADYPFLGIVAQISPTTGQLTKLEGTAILAAKTYLKGQNVPDDGRLYGVLSTVAEGDFIGDATASKQQDLIIQALLAGQGGGLDLLRNAIPQGQFTTRYGIKFVGSNAVTSQYAITALDGASAGTLAIASVAADTTKFISGDIQTTTPMGCLDLTLTVDTGLVGGVSVGTFIRVGPIAANSQPTGFGVILRINSTSATAPIITVALFSPSGRKLRAADITPGTDRVSVPMIGSISAIYHQEALLIANRRLALPSEGSGAIGASPYDPETNMTITVYGGQFDITRTRETRGAYYLTGAKVSDTRKGCWVLSQ